MTFDPAPILRRSDRGEPVADIATALGVPVGRVYSILREHRPNRERKPRRCTSDMPRKVRLLRATGWEPPRIASVLDISKAYVYRILSNT